MVETKDIYWLAGLLEGEGCFGIHVKKACLTIRLNMTDLDVVEKAHKLMGATSKIACTERSKQKEGWKDIYNFAVSGRRAAGWMMTLYPLMGNRRQARIREVLDIWKAHPAHKSRNFNVPRKINGQNNTEYARLWWKRVQEESDGEFSKNRRLNPTGRAQRAI